MNKLNMWMEYLREQISLKKNTKIFSIAIGVMLIPVAVLFFGLYGENYSLIYNEKGITASSDESIKTGENNDGTQEETLEYPIAGDSEATEPVEPINIICDISGEVINPGVYTLPTDSRLIDLIDAAGGLSEYADINSINRARLLVDGEKVYIPKMGEESTISWIESINNNSAEPQTGANVSSGKININTATSEELETLPNIGPVTAGKIIDYRTENGGFKSIEELKNVSGIGEKTFQKIQEKVTV